ncbi:hypothetical protein B7C42_06046 [Nocardia cerradoensis]|uniref:Uncharacterized protein n=1 Tax=Nocardia cerradoensis TaxID=85688 RepID=A0A231GYK6_9NOCA|nr:hypothetical protein B7C42_06046 [Nocardia cerradoensis]
MSRVPVVGDGREVRTQRLQPLRHGIGRLGSAPILQVRGHQVLLQLPAERRPVGAFHIRGLQRRIHESRRPGVQFDVADAPAAPQRGSQTPVGLDRGFERPHVPALVRDHPNFLRFTGFRCEANHLRRDNLTGATLQLAREQFFRCRNDEARRRPVVSHHQGVQFRQIVQPICRRTTPHQQRLGQRGLSSRIVGTQRGEGSIDFGNFGPGGLAMRPDEPPPCGAGIVLRGLQAEPLPHFRASLPQLADVVGGRVQGLAGTVERDGVPARRVRGCVVRESSSGTGPGIDQHGHAVRPVDLVFHRAVGAMLYHPQPGIACPPQLGLQCRTIGILDRSTRTGITRPNRARRRELSGFGHDGLRQGELLPNLELVGPAGRGIGCRQTHDPSARHTGHGGGQLYRPRDGWGPRNGRRVGAGDLEQPGRRRFGGALQSLPAQRTLPHDLVHEVGDPIHIRAGSQWEIGADRRMRGVAVTQLDAGPKAGCLDRRPHVRSEPAGRHLEGDGYVGVYIESNAGQSVPIGTPLRRLHIEDQGGENVCTRFRLGTAGEIAKQLLEFGAVVVASSSVALPQHQGDRRPAAGLQVDPNEAIGAERHMEDSPSVVGCQALDPTAAVATFAGECLSEPPHRLDLATGPPPVVRRPRQGLAGDRVIRCHLLRRAPVGFELVHGTFTERPHIRRRELGDHRDLVVGHAPSEQRENFDFRIGQRTLIRYRSFPRRCRMVLGRLVVGAADACGGGGALCPFGAGRGCGVDRVFWSPVGSIGDGEEARAVLVSQVRQALMCGVAVQVVFARRLARPRDHLVKPKFVVRVGGEADEVSVYTVFGRIRILHEQQGQIGRLFGIRYARNEFTIGSYLFPLAVGVLGEFLRVESAVFDDGDGVFVG